MNDYFFSLEDKIEASGGNPAQMLRSIPAVRYPFPYPPEWTSWHSEQWAWKNTCVLFDQSHHMSDIYYEGPDVKRLFSDTGVNSMANFGRGRARHFMSVGEDGYFIGDMILFGLEDHRYSLVGAPIVANWVSYVAERDGYDVTVTRDDATLFNPAGRRKLWRYQLNGPLTQDIVEKAVGAPLDPVKFFAMTEFEIAGTPVRALNHTMSGVPGDRFTGLELFGPAEHGQVVLDALNQAGAEFGMQRGGAMAYVSTGHESGWLAAPIPAIYSQESMKPYRESLIGFGLEASLVLEGSFVSDNIEDYYLDPFEQGYGSVVKFDHDFIGRSALEARRDAPGKKKVWLVWNDDDFTRVVHDSLFGEGDRPRIASISSLFTAAQHFDAVLFNDEVVGMSAYGGYTVNIGHVVTIAFLDESKAVDGTEVEIVWGEADGGRGRAFMEPHHTQTRVRATVSTRPPASHVPTPRSAAAVRA